MTTERRDATPMRTRTAGRAATMLIVAATLAVGAVPVEATDSATAPPRSEHDWARDAVRAGEIRSLAEILKRLEREFHGQVVEIELERDEDRIVYEIELLTPGGHVVELTYDARTGVLLEADGRDLDGARRQAGL